MVTSSRLGEIRGRSESSRGALSEGEPGGPKFFPREKGLESQREREREGIDTWKKKRLEMGLDPNSLITTTDLNKMGFAPTGARPAGTNQNQTKGRIEDYYRVETGAQPWASYPTNRLPTRATALDVHLGCVQTFDYFLGYAYGECGAIQLDELRQVVIFFTDGNGNVQSREQIAAAVAAGMPAPAPLVINYVQDGYGIEYPNTIKQYFYWDGPNASSYPYKLTYYTRNYVADPYDQSCLGYRYEYWVDFDPPYSYCGTIFTPTAPTTSYLNPTLQTTWAYDLQGQYDTPVPPASNTYAFPLRQNGANSHFTLPAGLQVKNVRIYNIAGGLLYDANGVTWIQGNFGLTGGYPNFGGWCGLASANYTLTYSVWIAGTNIQTQSSNVIVFNDPEAMYCSPSLYYTRSVTFTNLTGASLDVRWYGFMPGTSELGLRRAVLAPESSLTRCIHFDTTLNTLMYYAAEGISVSVGNQCTGVDPVPTSEICYFGIYVWVTTAGIFKYTDCNDNTVFTASLPLGLNFLPVCVKWGTFLPAGVPIAPQFIGQYSSFGYTTWCPS